MIIALGICIIAVVAVSIAFIQREISPEYNVVQQFEIPPVSSRLGISAKGASDIVDMLNRTATDGSRFHGAEILCLRPSRYPTHCIASGHQNSDSEFLWNRVKGHIDRWSYKKCMNESRYSGMDY